MADIYSTADLNRMLAEELSRKQRQPVRSSFFNALVPQVSAADAAINRPDPVERASLFPLATYPDGSTRLALPGMIAEDIPRAFTAPARAYRGEIPDEDMISEGLNFAGNMAMTGSIAPKPTNAAGMFGGRLAKTADHAALARAEEMAAKGAPRDDIWSQTGWFQGPDKKWRFEIDDSGATYNGTPGKLRNAMSHDEAFSAYPRLERVNVEKADGPFYAGRHGLFERPRMAAGDLSEALHEMQHGIQNAERFGRGGSTTIAKRPEFDAVRADLAEQLRTGEITDQAILNLLNGYGWPKEQWSLLGSEKAADLRDSIANEAIYKKFSGETESRAVEARKDLTPEQRSARPPWLDYDVPESQQIVRFNANASESAAPGVVVAEAGKPIRAYRGVDFARPNTGKLDAMFSSSEPRVADAYANQFDDFNKGGVYPVDVDFRNPYVVDAKGSHWTDVPHNGDRTTTEDLARFARDNGHDGLVVNNVVDVNSKREYQGPATTYAALKRGTVRSATTGDLLFENGKNAAAPGALASEAARQLSSAPTGTIYDKFSIVPGAMPGKIEAKGYRGQPEHFNGIDYGPWASSNPDVANSYARDAALSNDFVDGSHVSPLTFKFNNPLVVDAHGKHYSSIPIPGIGHNKIWSGGAGTEDIAQVAKWAGHDGLIINNVLDSALGGDVPSTVYHAIKPGTTYSSITGELLFENGANASAPGAIASEAARQPLPVKMEVPFYRGSANGQTAVDYNQPYWGTTDKSLASDYAKSRSGMYFRDGTTPNVTPAVGRFRNPLYIDAQNAGWSDIPFEGQKWNSDKLADLAKERGHDGLVIDRLYDEGKFDEAMGLPATVAALRPGTVSSAFDTNNILYANSKSSGVPGALIAEAADSGPWYHGTRKSFDKFSVPDATSPDRSNGGWKGVSFTQDKAEAGGYAGQGVTYRKRETPLFVPETGLYSYVEEVPHDYSNGTGRVIEANVNASNPYRIPFDEAFNIKDRYGFSDDIAKRGYDAIDVMKGDKVAERVALKPGTVFDKSGNVLFENGQNAVAPGVLASEASKRVENPDDAILEILRRYGVQQ